MMPQSDSRGRPVLAAAGPFAPRPWLPTASARSTMTAGDAGAVIADLSFTLEAGNDRQRRRAVRLRKDARSSTSFPAWFRRAAGFDHLVRPAAAGHAAQGRLHAAEGSPVPVAHGTRERDARAGNPRRAARGEARQRAHVLLDQFGLHGFRDYYPATLSGGMRQRVALARTLVNDPEVLLLDEPFAALDFQTKLVIESDMARLVRSQHRSVLLITHDIEEAVSAFRSGDRAQPPAGANPRCPRHRDRASTART